MRSRVGTGLLIIALLGAPLPGAAATATVDLRESACVESEQITLAQIALIAPAGRAEELGAVEVGPAPLPGGGRRLTLGYLKIRLRRSGVACDEIAFTGADVVEVRRALTPAVTHRRAQGEVEAADRPGARPSPHEPAAVDRGTRLRLTVICGAVVIGAEATLLENAVVGGRAKMRVEQTRETVVAQIVQPSEALIRRE